MARPWSWRAAEAPQLLSLARLPKTFALEEHLFACVPSRVRGLRIAGGRRVATNASAAFIISYRPEPADRDGLCDDIAGRLPCGALAQASGHSAPGLGASACTGDASWLDLFCGDLAETADTPDLEDPAIPRVASGDRHLYHADRCRIQHLGRNRFAGFPPLSEQVVWLIGISHAEYIAYKAAQTLGKSDAGGQPCAAPSRHRPHAGRKFTGLLRGLGLVIG